MNEECPALDSGPHNWSIPKPQTQQECLWCGAMRDNPESTAEGA